MHPAHLFQDEASPAADSLFVAAIRNGVVVPAIWPLEVANILRQGERRGRIAVGDLSEACRRVLLLPVEVEPMTPAGALGPVLALAARHGLTAYDAAYLELAQRRGLPLATRDAALIRAAPLEGVAVLPA
ncbi:type II toxin-antitoxin system VapC family toxin [Falsiroseomonas sp. E2-1-a4]|uniref:type II toxin-antitoxin system VapC family toxin n=1 Tax=Falsiroseomonas sp. E2-1-a4 TaxID=3239299 RepID=UPI003F328A7D